MRALAVIFLTALSQIACVTRSLSVQSLTNALAPARGEQGLTAERFKQIEARLLAWIDASLQAGATADRMNCELKARGLTAATSDDMFTAVVGSIGEISIEPMPGADDLMRVSAAIGHTCAHHALAAIYRRKPLRRIGWITHEFQPDSAPWAITSLAMGAPDPGGRRILAAGFQTRWCSSTWGGNGVAIATVLTDRLRVLSTHDAGGRILDPVMAVVEGPIVTFEYQGDSGEAFALERTVIERYRVDGVVPTRIAPLAPNILGFIQEWRAMTGVEAARWSGPEAAQAHAALASWNKSVFVEFVGLRQCTGIPRIWQVTLEHEKDRRVFTLSEDGRERLRMLNIGLEPSADCPQIEDEDKRMEALFQELP